MSQHRHQGDQFEPSDQDRIPFPVVGSAQYPTSAPSAPSYLAHHPMTSALHQVPSSLRGAQVQSPTPAQSTQAHELALFQAIAAQQSQASSLYAEPPDLSHVVPVASQPHIVQASLSMSAPLQPHPVPDIYSHPEHARSLYTTPIWPTVQSRDEPYNLPATLTATSVPIQSESSLVQTQQQSVNYPTYFRGSSSTMKRQRQPEPTISQALRTDIALATASQSDEEPPLDTRKGKERVQRPCTKCGEMNHIRKNYCWKCEAPKEPAKKRTKRVRRKKNRPRSASSSGLQVTPAALQAQRAVAESEMNRIAIERASSLVRGHVPPQDEIQNVFDPRHFVMQTVQQQPQGSAGRETSQPVQTQRSDIDLVEGSAFDDRHRCVPHDKTT